MKRGDVYYADLDPTRGPEQSGRRPVLIVQRNALNAYTRTIIVAPLTSSQVEKYRQLPSCVFLSKDSDDVPLDSVVLCHQLRVLALERLDNYVGHLPDKTMAEVDKVLAYILQLK